MRERYGEVFAFAIPGRQFVVLNDPALIKDVLVTQQHAFHKNEGVRALRNLLGNGLLTSEDPLHRQMRRIVQPAFHHRRIAGYARTIQAFAHAWLDERHDGEILDMHASMSALTLRAASVVLFGADASAQADVVRAALRDAVETFPTSIGPLGRFMRRFRLPPVRRFERARAALDGIIYALIAQRRQSGKAGEDALSLLLELEDAESGFRPDDEQIRDEAMTLFIAGHETTANALSWVWYLLAKHPEAEAKLHAELDHLDASQDPLEVYASLDYTQRVIREAMRLYPPAWIIGRESQIDLTLVGGYPIARKTTVFMAPYLLHRSEHLYPDPLRFDPDRWLTNADLPPFAYVPFGGGARRCIGEEFAWMEATIVLATLARRFRFALSGIDHLEIEPLITLRPKGAVPMQVNERP